MIAPVGQRGSVQGNHTIKKCAKGNIMRRVSEETLTSGTRGAWLTTDRFISSLSQFPVQGLPSHPFLTGSAETNLHMDKVRVGLLRKDRLFPKTSQDG